LFYFFFIRVLIQERASLIEQLLTAAGNCSFSSMFFLLLSLSLSLSLSWAQVNFVAVGENSAGNSIAYSSDGITWTIAATQPFTQLGLGVAYSKEVGLWVAVGGGTNTIAWSNDGITWTGSGMSVITAQGKAIAYSAQQNLWVAGGVSTNSLARSVNGKNWIGSGSVINSGVSAVAYSNAVSRWVAVGNGAVNMAWSSDGITWIGFDVNLYGWGCYSVVYFNNLFVAGGSNSTISNGHAWSNDGIVWSAGTGGFPPSSVTAPQDYAYGQGKWIATGTRDDLPSPNIFANSTDGKTWVLKATVTPQMGNGLGIVYNQALDRWVVVGTKGTLSSITYSADGNNWSPATDVFALTGYAVATRDVGSLPAGATVLNTDITNLVTNTSVIPSDASIGVSGSLTVIGNLTIAGSLSLGLSSKVNVTATLDVRGAILFNASSSNANFITCDLLDISPGSVLTVVLSSSPGIGGVAMLKIATFARRSGTFSTANVQTMYGVIPGECPAVSEDYSSSSTLTVTVTVNQCSSGGGTSGNAVVPVGVIVGTALGGVVLVAIGVIAAVVLMKRRQKQADLTGNALIRQTELEALKKPDIGVQPSAGVNL
jgi:hypothetical protein